MEKRPSGSDQARPAPGTCPVTGLEIVKSASLNSQSTVTRSPRGAGCDLLCRYWRAV